MKPQRRPQRKTRDYKPNPADDARSAAKIVFVRKPRKVPVTLPAITLKEPKP